MTQGSTVVVNRSARHEYTVADTLVAGVVLTGGEVKSVRQGSASLRGSFVKVLDGEAYLLNAQISPYTYADNRDYDPKRTRKLLLKKRELATLQSAQERKGVTCVPLEFKVLGRYVKLVVGIARGKKQHERRQELRERDLQREMRHEQ